MSTEEIASARLEVSRTAYREAMKVLAAKGLVDSRPKVGTRVKPRSEWNILDPDVLLWASEMGTTTVFADTLFEFRLIIEPAAARLAAEKRLPAPLQAVQSAIARMHETEPDTRENLDADLSFHAAILQASGNELLSSLNYVVEALLERSLELSSHNPGARAASVPLHQAVCDHILRGDPEAAQNAMSDLLISARKDIEWIVHSGTEQQNTRGGN